MSDESALATGHEGGLTARPFCSDGARARGDGMDGSAPPVRRWLLVEHPGPWHVDALAGSRIAPGVRSALQVAAGRVGGRIVLVRRPGRQPPAAHRRWGVVGRDGSQWGTWVSDDDLLAAADAMRGDLPTAAAPVLLVCAHGRHDTCCAVRGRPVAAALARTWPDATWECSHVGGDRFAPNVVVLPDGWYYGGLDPAVATDVVAEHLAGRVDPAHSRGLCSEPPAAQVAVLAAHARWGPWGADDVASTDVWAVTDRLVEVLLATPSGPARVRVAASTSEPALLTCRALRPSRVTRWAVVDAHHDAAGSE